MGLWTRKSLEEVTRQDPEESHALRRTLTSTDLVMLGIGAIIGAGLFSITGVAAALHTGPAIVISFVIAAIGCLFAALCYSELASMIPVSGSAYTYAYATMGQFVAWLIGWDLILEYAIGAVAVAISWSGYLVSILHDFGINLPSHFIASPWQPVTLSHGEVVHGDINLPAVFILFLCTALLIYGVKQSTLVNAIIVVIKVSVVILFIALGFGYINSDNYVPFIPENTGNFGEFGWSGVFRGAGIVFFAYIGFDALSTATQEAKNPQKSMSIGILGSLLICTILYVLFAFVLTGLANYKLLNNAAPVAVAMENTPFVWISALVKLAILAGFTSVILVLLYGQSRILYVMAMDGLLPSIFCRIHPTLKTPWISSLILFVSAALVAAFTPLSLVGKLTSIGTLLAFVIVCMGVMILRYRHPEYPRSFRTPWVPLVPILGILTCLVMMVTLDIDTWVRMSIWMALGLIVYFGYSCRRA